MRRLLAALFALTVLNGCDALPSAVPDRAVLLVAGRQLDFVREMELGFVDGVARVDGVEHEQIGPDIVDNAQELKAFQKYTEGRHGPVAVFTLTPELFAASFEEASDAGTPLIALHSNPAPGSGVRLFIGNDNAELGRSLGRAIAERLPADASGVVVLGSPAPGIQVLDARTSGFRAEMRRLRPRVTVIGPFDTKQDPAANMQSWRTLQIATPDALAYAGVGGADAHNLALLRTPATTRIDGGFGTDPHALELTAAGSMVLVSTEPYLQGRLAGDLQARAASTDRELPEGWLVTPGLLIDRANAAEVITRQRSATNREEWFEQRWADLLARPDDHLRPLGEAV